MGTYLKQNSSCYRRQSATVWKKFR